MVLQKGHKRRGLEIEGWGTTPLLLPHIALSLEEIAPLEGRNKFLRGPPVITVIGCTASGECYPSTVVEVVVPEHVKAISTPLWWADQLRMLRLVLGY
jgi:hypothetical protein